MRDVAAITESTGIDWISLDDGEHVADGPTGSIARQPVRLGIGEDQYGVGIIAVREIRECAEVIQMPRQPQGRCSLLNRCDVAVPIIDLGYLLGARGDVRTNRLSAGFSAQDVAA